MRTTRIFLPESLLSFVEKQVVEGGYASASEYVRELIRHDRDRRRLRDLLLEGAASPPTEAVNASTCEALRDALEDSPLLDPEVLDRLEEVQRTDLPPDDPWHSD